MTEALICGVAVVAGLTLLALGEAFQTIMFSIAASGFWLLVGAYGFMNTTAIWDLSYFLGWMGMAMAMASGLHAVTIRNKVGSFTSDEEDKQNEVKQPERRLTFRERINQRQQVQRKKRADDFAKTGKM